MKLSDIKGERAIEVIADLIEPIAEIAADDNMKDLFSAKPVSGKTARQASAAHLAKKVPALLKSHKSAVVKILATLNQTDVESMNVFSISRGVIEMLSDPEVIGLFTSAARNVENEPPTDTSTKSDEE